MKRPHILIVLCDQWRAQATGYAGDPNVATPNLDRLAKESIHFSNATSNCPVCTPARATLLTGQHAHRHGLIVNDAPLDPEIPSLGKVLASAGYQTGWIGKWHVDGHGRREVIPRERRHGFEVWKALECNHNYWESPYYDGDDTELSWWSGPHTECEYDAFAQTNAAIDFLADRDTSRPFALCLSFGAPHEPYDKVPSEFLAAHEEKRLRLRPNVPPKLEESARRNLRGYYAHCAALDRCIGQLDDALKAHGLDEETLLLFISDHGDSLNSHGYWFKQLPWEESVGIPCLLRWPGLGEAGRGRRDLTPISLVDIMPTLLGLTHCPIPSTVQGRDYSSVVHGKVENLPDAAYLQIVVPQGTLVQQGGPAAREWRGLRTPTHTYARALDGPWLLYDNLADPYQLFNLVDDAAHRRLRDELDQRLQATMRDLGDALLPAKEWADRFGYRLNERNLINS